jgi:hypothetical protein
VKSGWTGGLDDGSHVVENEMLIAREIVGGGAHGESTERKLDKLCRTGKGDPMASRAQPVVWVPKTSVTTKNLIRVAEAGNRGADRAAITLAKCLR